VNSAFLGMSKINQRKIDHVQLVGTHSEIDRQRNYFDRIHLSHRALPELALEEIESSISLMGKSLSFPLLISSMTGGSDDSIVKLNHNLAVAAEATGVALAVGSQRVLLQDPSAASSFALRSSAPDALLIGNIGAVQLNYGVDIQAVEQMVEVMQADALYLHLNPLQEAVQPEGDTNFYGLAAKIGQLVKSLSVPVIVKEVGCGLSAADAELLIEAGVKHIDVAGAGGTSWALVESKRSDQPELGELFSDWGIPTPEALRLMQPFSNQVELIASGGIRNGIDMAKAMILGASVCGLARPFLAPAQKSPEAVIEVIERLKREFCIALFLLGVESASALIGREELMVHEDRD
jgi:isopentenyl-diphosphate delta-isomerase